jgi:hypothetical protein
MQEENELSKAISGMVDDWVGGLIRRLLARGSAGPKRGLWDRFKGGISNLIYGRDKESNPYYWRNRFGDDLGAQAKEHFDPSFLTLSQYGSIKRIIEEAEKKAEEAFLLKQENSGGEENLQIVRVLRSAADELKQKLLSFFSGQSLQPAKKPNQSPPPKPAQNVVGEVPRAKGEKERPESSATNSGGSSSQATNPNPGNTPTEDKVPKKGTFESSLRETLELVKQGEGASIVPDKSWLTDKGFLSVSALPKAIVWLGLKSHINMSEDEDVKKELGKALVDFKKITEFKKGSSILRLLKQNIKIGDYKQIMIDLGVDEAKIESLSDPKPEEKKAEAPKAEAPKAEAPKAEAPKAEAPKAEAPKAAPKPEEKKAEAPKAEENNPLKKLYEGKETAEEIRMSIHHDLLNPLMKITHEKSKLSAWWKKIQEEKSEFEIKDWIEFINNSLVESILNEELSGIEEAKDIYEALK